MRAQTSVVTPFDASTLEDEVREAVRQGHPHVQALDFAPRTMSGTRTTKTAGLTHARGHSELYDRLGDGQAAC